MPRWMSTSTNQELSNLTRKEKNSKLGSNKVRENEKVNLTKVMDELQELSRTNIKVYSSNVIPNSKPIIGVRIPDLRNLAKKLAKEDYQYFVTHCPEEYYEQQVLKALVLGYAKDEIETILSFAGDYVPHIQDWSVSDSFCQTFIIARKNRDRVFEWLMQYRDSEGEYLQRVVAVMLMSHFLVDEFIDSVLEAMNGLKHPGYYTKMGVAWCIATAYAKYPEKTHAFMLKNDLDHWTYNKAIQKMIESFRITNEDKQALKTMKRKV